MELSWIIYLDGNIETINDIYTKEGEKDLKDRGIVFKGIFAIKQHEDHDDWITLFTEDDGTLKETNITFHKAYIDDCMNLLKKFKS